MKRSPLNNAAHSGRPYGARHSPYNWKSHENAFGGGYQSMEDNSYQRFPVSNAGPRPSDDDFIPLNVSTPMTRHEKYNSTNRYSPSSGQGNPGSGWYNNYRGNYHSTPRSNNRHSAYKHAPKQFHGQKRKGYKGAHRQVNVSAYVDMNSFLEDPWEDLAKKLDDSKDTNKSKSLPESESLSNPKLADSDLAERSGSKLSTDTNLDDSRCSQECKNERSADTSFETNTDFSQVSKVDSSIESEIGSSQDLPNESSFSTSDKTCGTTQENSIHSNTSDIDGKDI